MLECVLTLRARLRFLASSVKVLDRFALHDDSIGTLGQNRFDGELVTHAHVANSARERALVSERLVPESTQRREAPANEDLVDWRIVADPGVPSRKCARVLSEE